MKKIKVNSTSLYSARQALGKGVSMSKVCHCAAQLKVTRILDQ